MSAGFGSGIVRVDCAGHRNGGGRRHWARLSACALILVCAAIAARAQQDWTRIAMLLLIAPLLEEAVFRAGVQEALARHWRPGMYANVGTALLFGAAHAALRGDPAAAIAALPSLALGLLYQRSGSLRDCVMAHAAMNAAWLAWQLAAGGLPLALH